MNLPELLWTIAFCTFLVGGAWSFRSDGSWPAIGLMAVGATLDAAVAFLPQMGVEALGQGPTSTNGVIIASIATMMVVYALFVAGVILTLARPPARIPCLPRAGAGRLWFLSFIGFVHGLNIVPGAPLR